jgi:hypothetical protein
MAFKLGSTEINKVYLGSTEINSIYLGSTEVYSGVSFDADAQAYFTAVETAGGTLSNDFKTYYNTMILGLKSDGVYSKLLRFNPNAGGVEASAEVDQIIPSTNNINFVNSPTIDSTIGVTFNGSNQYATTGFVPSTEYSSADNWQTFVFCLDNTGISTNQAISGAYQGLSQLVRLWSRFSSRVMINGYANCRQAYSIGAINNNSLILGSRTSYTQLDIYINATSEGSDTGNNANAPSIEEYYGTYNNNGTPASYTTGKWCFLGKAENMTGTDVGNLYARITTFLTAIGAI